MVGSLHSSTSLQDHGTGKLDGTSDIFIVVHCSTPAAYKLCPDLFTQPIRPKCRFAMLIVLVYIFSPCHDRILLAAL